MTNYEDIHIANIKRYEREIAAIYRKYAEEVTRLGANITGAKAPFSFDNYPETKKLVDKLLKNLAKETNATVISAIKKEVALANDNVNSIAQNVYDKGNGSEVLTVAQTAEWFRRYTSTSLEAADKFAQRRIRGLNLSDRVWKISQQLRTDAEIVIEQGITEGRSAAEMAKDVKAALNDPSRLFRRVKQPDGTLRLSKAAKDYHPGQGVYRSSYKNALRLTGTEANIAYRSSFHDRIQSQDWITGIEVRLSNNHTCKDDKGGLIKGWKDICDELKGIYPKDFMFTGWHPNCYDPETEVLTSGGWRRFYDVLPEDLIYSLNPGTRLTEWVGISDVQQVEHTGYLIHFKGAKIDCKVTPAHDMVGLAHQTIKRVAAKDHSGFLGFFYDKAGEGLSLVSGIVCSDWVPYSGKVYDLTLERNHIMYVRRNGKCFWGSNCRCEQIIVRQDPIQAIKEFKQRLTTAKQITELPQSFKDWQAANLDKIEGWKERGTTPYFLRDNEKMLNI